MGSKSESIEKKKCVTHEFRVSFPAVFEPKSFEEQAPQYSLVMLFDENADLGKPANGQKISLKRAAKNAAEEKWGPMDSWAPKLKKKIRMPFRDGNDKDESPEYKDTIFVTATSKVQPGLVGPSLRPILKEDDFYAGCYARAEVIAFAYEKAGNMGVSFALQNIQKLRDGTPFSGRRTADSVFEAVSTDEEEDDFEDDEEDEDDLGF